MVLSERLKKLRTDSRYRQEDVATRLDIARTTYASYEQGFREPDFETLQNMADLYGVSVDYLLGRTNVPIVNLNNPIDTRSDAEQKAQAWLRSDENLNEEEKSTLSKEMRTFFEVRKQSLLNERKNKPEE